MYSNIITNIHTYIKKNNIESHFLFYCGTQL